MNLRDDALKIWRAGVAAVDSERLVSQNVSVSHDRLSICDQQIPLNSIRRLEIVGAGKAGAGMAAALESVLRQCPADISISGWVNVPEDCVRSLDRIHLHAARPPAINEPTLEGVRGTAEILRRVSGLNADDVCVVLLSGGGSALLCQPVPEISLADKLAVTRALAADGAPIHELNCVRTQLSLVKGGRLAAACRARLMVALVISDVVGDPLEIIGSGPTTPSPSTANDALSILQRRGLLNGQIPETVVNYLQSRSGTVQVQSNSLDDVDSIVAAAHDPRCQVQNRIIGNNQTAMQAAAETARQLGYDVVDSGSDNQLEAAEEGRRLFLRLQQLNHAGASSGVTDCRKVCLLSGGEPTVKLAETNQPRKGGRNQELVLAAIAMNNSPQAWKDTVLLSGGTDGEDGPTDAAGAFADSELVSRMQQLGLIPADYLSINNSYPFFDRLHGLIRTGPTHTNVMDLRVGLVQCH